MYGRGTCDVKGGMAAMIAAMERLLTHRGERAATIVFSATVNEEVGFSGAKALARLWQPAAPGAPASDAAAGPPGPAVEGRLSARCVFVSLFKFELVWCLLVSMRGCGGGAPGAHGGRARDEERRGGDGHGDPTALRAPRQPDRRLGHRARRCHQPDGRDAAGHAAAGRGLAPADRPLGHRRAHVLWRGAAGAACAAPSAPGCARALLGTRPGLQGEGDGKGSGAVRNGRKQAAWQRARPVAWQA